MRFYQGLLPAIIWDPKINAPKVEFKKGVFDTEDEDIIAFLHEKGYLVEDDVRVLEAGGNITHGGFEPKEPVDKDLPSGRAPMDNPEMAPGGIPRKRENLDTLPESEHADLAKVQTEGGLADNAPVATDPQKRPRAKKQSAQRKIARRSKK